MARLLEDRELGGEHLTQKEATLLGNIQNQLAQLTLESAEYAGMMRAALGS